MVRTNRDTAGWERRRRAPPKIEVDVADELALRSDVEDVFERLRDIDTVALCLPGLVPGSLQSEDGERVFGSVRQTVLGVTATWQLEMTMRPDPLGRTLSIELDGVEQRLGMKLTGVANVAVVPASAASTTLRYTGHVAVEGRLASTGAPVIHRLVQETLRRFVEALGAPAKAELLAPQSSRWRRFVSWLRARWPRRARRRA
jgi:carbon monoxide dehydrogenase subunit G